MSKENVGLFVAALTKGGNLGSSVAASDRTPSAWVSIGSQAGYEFSADDVHAFMKELLERDELEQDAAVEAFFSASTAGPGELSEDQLDAVAAAGGTSMAFSSSLTRRLTSLGFGGGAGNVAAYEEFPPMHILSPGKLGQVT